MTQDQGSFVLAPAFGHDDYWMIPTEDLLAWYPATMLEHSFDPRLLTKNINEDYETVRVFHQRLVKPTPPKETYYTPMIEDVD